MSIYHKAQEKAISRVLSEHVEQGVPDDADVWSLVEKRLAEREEAQEPLRERRWYDWVMGVGSLQSQASAAGRSQRRSVLRYAGLAAGLVGLVLLTVLTTVVISRLSHRQTTAQPGGDNAILFSVTPSPNGIHTSGPGGRNFAGLAVADDGSFWIGDADHKLLHFSRTGDLVKVIDISSLHLFNLKIHDIDIWGDYIWMLSEEGDFGSVYFVRKLAQDGSVLNTYRLPSTIRTGTITETLLNGLIGLRMGGEGQVLLEREFGAPYVQIVDAKGNLAVQASGYRVGGKIYSSDNPSPQYITVAGDVWGQVAQPRLYLTVNISETLSSPVSSLYMMRVQPDGSFYVVAEMGQSNTSGQLILHYSADGKLIERARVPLTGPYQYSRPYDSYVSSHIASGPDGRFYALIERDGGSMGIRYYISVRKITFYPADQPMPEPPTPVPTLEMPVPDLSNVTPLPTPIQDLATLVQKAEIIARVKLTEGRNARSQSSAYDLEVKDWLKRPITATTDHLRLDVYHGVNGDMPVASAFNDTSLDDYVLFLNTSYEASNGPVYKLTDAVSGVFGIRDAMISYPGIPRYKGWAVGALKVEILAIVSANATPTPNPPVMSLISEGAGNDLEVSRGTIERVQWLGSSHLWAEWWDFARQPGNDFYSSHWVDLATGNNRPISYMLPWPSVIDATGKRIVCGVGDKGTIIVSLLEISTGETQTLATLIPEPAAGQKLLDITWAGLDALVVTEALPDRDTAEPNSPYNWGKILLIDIPTRSVQTLAEEGRLAGTFSDGSVLIQKGWIDGEMQLFTPPYKSPTTISPAGTWRTAWSLSPDREKVAWLDMTPPPGDWSKRLPGACCSGDSVPKITAITVWDHATARVQQFPVSNFSWITPDIGWSDSGEQLRWRKDSKALFYSRHPNDPEPGIALYQLDMNGQSTLLAEQKSYGAFKVVAEGDDGSIYYMIGGTEGQNAAQLLRRHPDGAVDTLRDNSVPYEWSVDEKGRLISLKDGGIEVHDLNTNEARRVTVPGKTLTPDDLQGMSVMGLVSLSPDGQWAIYQGDLATERKLVHILRVK